jgi:peroxiredoxin
VCAKNAPVVNRLYHLIQDDSALAKGIKIIGIACLDNKKKADAYKTNFRVPFPIFTDEKGDIWRAVGMPGTPTMVLTTKSGKVLMSHVGVIEDFDGFVKELKEIHQKQ